MFDEVALNTLREADGLESSAAADKVGDGNYFLYVSELRVLSQYLQQLEVRLPIDSVFLRPNLSDDAETDFILIDMSPEQKAGVEKLLEALFLHRRIPEKMSAEALRVVVDAVKDLFPNRPEIHQDIEKMYEDTMATIKAEEAAHETVGAHE